MIFTVVELPYLKLCNVNNSLEHVMVKAMGRQAEKDTLKPYDQVSVKEAIKIEKELMKKEGK